MTPREKSNKETWQPRSEGRLNFVGIALIRPEEQHPVKIRTDVYKATLVMRWKDAQYSTIFLHKIQKTFVKIKKKEVQGPFCWCETQFPSITQHHLRMLCAKFGWNWPSGLFLEKKINMRKVYKQTDRHQTIRKK